MPPAHPINHGIPLIWGADPVPELPAGWTVQRGSEKTPVIVISPRREEYLIGGGWLYPWLACPSGGMPNSKLKPGQRYIFKPGAIPVPSNRPVVIA